MWYNMCGNTIYFSALGIFTSGQRLDLGACKAWHPHGFVLLASVGMLILQSPTSFREAPPLCFISLSSKHKGTTTREALL